VIEADAIKWIVQMLESQNDDVRWSTVHTVGRMAEHGVIIHLCMIFELTNSTQRTSGVP
jgi:hypothetical protein